MKLSKEASKMFAEYQRSQSECDTPSYLEPGNLDKSFDAIRRINATSDAIFGQVVCAILKQNNISLLNVIVLEPINGVSSSFDNTVQTH